MKIKKYNRKLFIIRYLVCLMILAALIVSYWVKVRLDRVNRAERIAAQTVEYIKNQIEDMAKLADIPAAWLDVEGDQVKKEITKSGDQKSYREAFERVAKSMFDADSMAFVELVPDGIVTCSYPGEKNEALIGKDLKEEDGELLADAAAKKELAIIGPEFMNKLGIVLNFCMPVYYESGELWGYTALLMRLPEALQAQVLNRLAEQGYDYELRCIVDEKNRKSEKIAGTVNSLGRDAAAGRIMIQDKEWTLAIRPADGWLSAGRIVLTLLAACFAALLLAWIITQWKTNHDETMNQLKSDARHDKMTGLLNHTSSAEAIDQAMTTIEGGVLLLIDVDDFKVVNDTAGHLAGDEVLVEIANAMRTTFRRGDILGRYGGDEFIVYMIGDVSIPDFSVKASQFQAKIRKIPMGTTGRCITCSIGGARRCVETPTAESMVHRADQALYTSKGTGKDRFTIFDDAGSTVIVTPKQGEMKYDYMINE